MARRKRLLAILVVVMVLLLMHGLQWFYGSCGWVIAEQDRPGGGVFRVRAFPYSAFEYVILSTLSLSYRPGVVDCSYRCEIWGREEIATCNTFAWDSLYNPEVSIRQLTSASGGEIVEFVLSEQIVHCTLSHHAANWSEEMPVKPP